MKRIIILGCLLFGILQVFAQNQTDTIEVKTGLSTVFLQNGLRLTPRQLLNLTESNTEAYTQMKIAKNNYDVSVLFGAVGGFMVGWPIGTALANGDPNWTIAGIGAGIIVLSIPFAISYSNHAKKAVRIYNDGLKQSGMNNIDVRLGLTYNGIGIKMRF